MKLILTPTNIIYEPTNEFRTFGIQFQKYWIEVSSGQTINTKAAAHHAAREIAWKIYCEEKGIDPMKKQNEVVV